MAIQCIGYFVGGVEQFVFNRVGYSYKPTIIVKKEVILNVIERFLVSLWNMILHTVGTELRS